MKSDVPAVQAVTEDPGFALDDVDRHLVRLLIHDSRMSGAELSRRLGVSESTASVRLRNLRNRGVISGFTVRVDWAKLNLPVQAMISVGLGGHTREDVETFEKEVSQLDFVLDLWNVSGDVDFIVHVTCGSTEELRSLLLDNITGRPGVNKVQTSIIFNSVSKLA